MSYEIAGIQPANTTPTGCPSPGEAAALLKTNEFNAHYEPANFVQRVGDEYHVGEPCHALVVDWGMGIFAFLAPDKRHATAEITMHVRRKLKLMAADDDAGFDSLETGS